MQVSDTVIRNPYYMGYENKIAEQSETNGNKSGVKDEIDHKNLQSVESLDATEKKHETNYAESLMHLFKVGWGQAIKIERFNQMAFSRIEGWLIG